MEIRIYERNLTLAAVSDGAHGVTASESFAGAGACTLTVPLSEADLFQRERILLIPGIETGYVIESVQADAAAGTAAVSGTGVLSCFDRCLLPEDVVYAGAAEPLLTELAVRFGSAALAAPLSTVEFGLTEQVNTVLADRSLLSAVRSVADAAGLGLRLAVREGEFVFNARPVSEGTIRLSRRGGDLIGGSRTWDQREYANRVILQGGDGTRVTVSAADCFFDGFDDASQPPREILRYASDIHPSRYLTAEEYLAALTAEGKRILAGCRPIDRIHLSVPSETAKSLRLGCSYAVDDETLHVSGRAVCVKKTRLGDRWRAELRIVK